MKSPMTMSSLLAAIRAPARRKGLRAVMKAAGQGGERLYLVGGCVRDLFLEEPLGDLDLVVEGDPSGLARRAAELLGGSAHGPSPFSTFRIDGPGGLRIDLAMARSESYASPAALPRVAPAPMEIDLLRRDFTVNAMAIPLTGGSRGKILDPARGMADLRAGQLRLLHAESLVDDPTRSFRGARYATRYGMRMAAGWVAAMSSAVRKRAFSRLSPARLRRELELIFAEERPSGVLSRCSRWSLLGLIDPGLRWSPAGLRAFDRACLGRAHRAGGDPPVFMSLFLALAPPGRRRRLARRLGLAGRSGERMLAASRAPEEIRRRLAAAGSGSKRVSVMEELSRIDELSREVASHLLPPGAAARAEELAEAWRSARPRLQGEDLTGLGVAPGARIGEILQRLRRARAAGKISTRREEVLMVKRLTR